MIPIRCYTCGKVISNVWDEYKERIECEDEDPGKVMDSLGIERYCCRRMLLTHVDIIDEIAPYG